MLNESSIIELLGKYLHGALHIEREISTVISYSVQQNFLVFLQEFSLQMGEIAHGLQIFRQN